MNLVSDETMILDKRSQRTTSLEDKITEMKWKLAWRRKSGRLQEGMEEVK